MKATVLKITTQKSRFGDKFQYVFFKGEDGKSYRTCLYPKYGNYSRWAKVIQSALPVVVSGLSIKGKLIDADSFPVIEGAA